MALPGDLADRPGLTAGHPVGYAAWRFVVQLYLPPATAGQWDDDDWDEAEWGGAGWVDITAFVRGVEWTRGTSELGGRPEVGTATVTLDNSEFQFSPIDPTNSYGELVEVIGGEVINRHFAPGTLFRIVCHNPADLTAGGLVHQFTGTVETWHETRFMGDRDSSIEVTCVETIAYLAGVDENALVAVEGDDDTADDRLERLGNAADWPYGYSWYLGGDWETFPLQSTDMSLNRLAECYLTGDSVGAVVRSDRAGYLIAYEVGSGPENGPNYAPTVWLAPNSDVDADSFNADPSEVVWLTDLEPIVNVVELARTGGTVQTATDPDSITLHGRRTFGRNDLINKSNTLTLDLAERKIYTNPLRLETLQVDGDADNRALAALMSLDVHNSLEVCAQARDGGVITVVAVVDGMTHTVTPVHEESPIRWTATYALGAQSAPTYTAP